MLIHRAYKLKLYPNTEQETKLKQFGGACRWLWNHLLAKNNQQYELDKKFIWAKETSASLPGLKNEFLWLAEIPAVALQRVTKHLDRALREIKSGKGFPKFKKKSNNRDSFYLTNQKIRLDGNRIKISKLGMIEFRAGRLPTGKIMGATVTQDGSEWFISVMCEQEITDTQRDVIPERTVGIDLGLKELAITSDGEILENPKFLKKSKKKIAKLQRQMAKCKKRSQNKKKKQGKLYVAHQKVRNQRLDYAHKFTRGIINQYDVICVEDLNISGMVRNRRLSASISDAGWSEILRQLQYKARWEGKHFVKIGRFAPSSQICSACGHRQAMPLARRVFECQGCDSHMDRDANASLNIRNWGFYDVGQGMPERVAQAANA